ncbi:MAG: MGH1-like glycoside hydrolase domain-containing protein [Gaiellaceae bacterium]
MGAPRPYCNPAEQAVTQTLAWGDVHSSRSAPADTMFANTGRKLYVIGDVDGGFRPRSNPYDLHAYGAPLPHDPLAGKLQGVWAQPVKALSAYTFVVRANGETWCLLNAETFTQTFAEAHFDFRHGNLTARRSDFAAQDRPMLFTTLKLRNTGLQPTDVQTTFFAYFDLEDAWFTSLAAQRNRGEAVTVNENQLIARAKSAPTRWAVIVSGDRPEATASVMSGMDGRPVGQLALTARLEPGSELVWTIGIVVESELGAEAAAQHLRDWLPQKELLLSEKRVPYETLLVSGLRFHSSDPGMDVAFDLARANLQMLEAESPSLGRYFYAGLENFPFWFSCDGLCSGIGLLAAGLVAPALNHLRIGAQTGQEGRIPHQVSPSGEVVGMGNVQESPQWILGVWDAYRWTGDRAFLAETYRDALETLFDYTLGRNDLDGDGYPSGPGFVERDDMGPKKLDSAVYTWSALRALAQMADVMGDTETATRSRSRADQIAARFDSDWWDAANGTYVTSLAQRTNRQVPAHHWTVITPLEVGLATPEHAATTLAALESHYITSWGLKHTAKEDARVWTLPTALLSQSAYRYCQPKMGFEMLQHLTDTLDHGSIGMYHELIPEGLCFVQLWSAGEFVRGVVEDLMGVKVQAHLHTIHVSPQLPEGWDVAELENLRFASHVVTVRVTPEGLTMTHVSGPEALTVVSRLPESTEATRTVQPGERMTIDSQ